jgi:protease-4
MISDSETVIEHSRSSARTNAVKAVVLRINSPGGGVGPLPGDLRRGPQARREEAGPDQHGDHRGVRGVIHRGGDAEVYANPGTMTGSIGVVMPFVSFKDLVDKIGLKGMAVKSGEFKDIGSPFAR